MTVGHGGPGLSSIIWDQTGMNVLSCRSYLPNDVAASRKQLE
jgi:hypothetical protein